MSPKFTLITVFLGAQTIPDYLRVALAHARAAQPDSRIVLLCDASEAGLAGIEVVAATPYMQHAIDLAPLYRHASVNDPAFELACFQRWFVMREFARKEGISSCMHIDGDVMMFATGEEVVRAFEGYDYTVSCGASWHCAYFASLAPLDAFCEMTEQIFKRQEPLWQRVKEAIGLNDHGEHSDNLTDMLVISLIQEFYKLRCVDTARPDSPLVFDHNINSAREGFEMLEGVKALHWVNGRPYVKHLASQKYVRLGAIHFQGAAKQLLAALTR